MNDVYYTPTKLTKNMLDNLVSNIKSDRNGEDLLCQVMIECNIELSAKITKEVVLDKDIFFVDDNYMIACFDDDVDEEVITEIAKNKPRFVVFKDSSMQSDAVSINIGEIFKIYSPDTRIKIL